MCRDLVTLRLEMPGDEALDLMQSCTHNAFPVLQGDKFVGMVTRKAVFKTMFPSRNPSQLNTSSDLINFSRVVDCGTYIVHEGTSVRRTYSLFRQLGLRHLPVVNADGKLSGIITRKDLAFMVSDGSDSPADPRSTSESVVEELQY